MKKHIQERQKEIQLLNVRECEKRLEFYRDKIDAIGIQLSFYQIIEVNLLIERLKANDN